LELEVKEELLQEEVFHALKNEVSEEELEIKENGVQNQLYQNSKEKQKQIKKRILCIPAKHVKNHIIEKEEEIKEQEN